MTIQSTFSRRSFLTGIGVGGAVAAGLAFYFRPGAVEEEAKLNFYNWDDYIGWTTLDDFKAASDITVKMELFADNDELFAKMMRGNPGYDLIVPSHDYIKRMVRADLLEPLDHSKIPNFVNIDEPFRYALFDPGRKYSIPYMWGTVGIGYRKSVVKSVPDSWKWLYDSDKYAGRIALLGEAATVLGLGLKYLGKSANSSDAALVKQVEEMLIKQKPHIKEFAEDNGQDMLVAGEVDLAMEWNGDMLQVMADDPDIGYTVPKEGGLLWEDTLCIPKGAPHPANAHAFINYILDAKVGARIADYIQYATPNKAAKALMADSYTQNPVIFPPSQVTEISEILSDKGDEAEQLFDETWARILAA